MSSHDDGAPFDAKRNKNRTGTKLLLSPGVKCIGDESARSLVIEGTQGDATYDL
jgi:alpha-amylase